jgi:hypothetical protein
MEIICYGEMKIKCDNVKCGEFIVIAGEDVTVKTWAPEDKLEGDEDGGEQFFIDHFLNCPNCQKDISINYELLVYPEGGIDTEDVGVSGATLVEDEFEFDVDM